MASFEVFSRVRIELDADDPADAERKVGAILKHAVESKGFEVQQVRAMPAKQAAPADEKIGIRSMLPKEVAEEGSFNEHLGGILRLVK